MLHRAAPRRSSTRMAVFGSLMPGDSARTATSTSCRTAPSGPLALESASPMAVALRMAASASRTGTVIKAIGAPGNT